ncbi:hypothetical protein KAX17_01030 [Candidatus Bipolaricaulota bacterium]|nr:hypothetical protein [Candidatus Bipolaricaulota bacterium]
MVGSGSFPNLNDDNHQVASPRSGRYNCVAWAAGKTNKNWWPSSSKDTYWPPGFRRGSRPKQFETAFKLQGYKRCEDGSLEAGKEKVCIYVDDAGNVAHMARQLDDGTWTSKLGADEDISHDSPDVLAGGIYGKVVRYLQRPRRSN